MSQFETRANPNQQEAILTTEGPLLIIAGPGSGKTFTLVERIVYLIAEKKTSAEELFIATFTEKAAAELITRVTNRLLELDLRVNINEMFIGTFHSICLKIIDQHREFTRLKRNYSLMDQFDQQYFVFQNLKEFLEIEHIDSVVEDPHKKSRWAVSNQLVSWINKISEEALDVGKLRLSENTALLGLACLFDKYQELLLQNNALDFSTIQYETLHLLENRPEVLKQLQDQFSYLMVDEYQDTNTIQELILFLLAGEKKNVCVVGDDDQGLYRFRGATIRNILEFPNRFNGQCKTVTLSTNYRSHPDIIELYNQWMKHVEWSDQQGTYRYPKEIVPFEGNQAEHPSVCKVVGKIDQDDWADEIIAFLRHMQANETVTDWNQVALLFRSVRSDKIKDLATRLENEGIPVYSPRSQMYFDRHEIKLMIGAIIFLFPQFKDVRQTGDYELSVWKYYDECFAYFAEEVRKPKNIELLEWGRRRAKTHMYMAENAEYGFSGLFYQLLQFNMFSQHLTVDLNKGVQETREARNLAIFSNMLVKLEYLHNIKVLTPEYLDKSIRDLFNLYLRFLIDGGIDEYQDASEYAPSGCISFMTIHQSKGLEFPVVMVGSLEAVPRKQYSDLDALLQNNYYRKKPFEPLEQIKSFDFWRLFYTAFSRAQNILALTCQENNASGQGTRNVPSKYFTSIYNGITDWRDIRDELANIQVEEVKEVNIKEEYSFTSHITLYENCAQQYRFFRELGFAPVRKNAMIFGSIVHQTIEDVHKAVLTGKKNLVHTDQISQWFEMNYSNLTQKERVYLSPVAKNIALNHILRYVKREGKDWSRLKEAEVDISLVKEGYILKGSVDLIRGENDTVEIIDFKSEKKPDLHNERHKIEHYKRQLEVYAHLVEERTGHKVSKTHLYYTGEEAGTPYVSFDHNRSAIENTIKGFDQVVERIKKHDYNIKERPAKLCKECDMRFYCEYNT